MSKIFLDIFNISIAAGWLITAVIAVRFLLKKHVPKWTLCLLWAVVGIRLLLPLSFESDLSLLPSGKTVNTETVITSPRYEHSENENIENHTPVYNYESINTNNYIDSGIKTIDDRINTAINEVVIQKPEENSIPLITDVASIIWILGIAGMTVYAVINYILLKRRIAVFLPVDKHIRKSENVGSPFILGVFMPKIYIPFGLEQSTENHVIAHEKAHIKRLDHLIKPLGFIMLTIHWFNPLVWIAYILLCRDIEMACDEKVVKNMSEDARKSYASALLECGIKRSYITACPIAFGEVGVKQRVKNALTYKKPIFWVIIAAVIICISLSVFFLTNPKDDSDIPQNTDQSEDNSQITDNNEKLIDFEEYYFDAYLTEYKCNTFPDPMTTFTAKTKEEFTRICSYTGDERFLKFAEELPENYFETKMFIFAYSWLNPSAIIDVTDIVAKGDTVTMNVTYENILENENIYTRLIVVSVEKEVAGSYENYVTKHISLAEAYVPKSENKISFTQHIFGGTYNYSSFSTPGISKAIKIGSDADFEEFLKEYEYSEHHSGTDMRTFAASLPDDYFKTKALIIIPAGLPMTTISRSRISEVYSDTDYLMLCANTDESFWIDSSLGTSIFAAEVNKADIRANAKVRCFMDILYFRGDSTDLSIPNKVSVVGGNYDSGYIPGINTEETYNNACFKIINSKDTLNEFLSKCSYDGTDFNFADFANSLSDDYFENNMFIAVSTLRKDSTQFKITAIKSGDVLDTLNIVINNAEDNIIPSDACIVVIETEKIPVSDRFRMIVEPLGPEKVEITVDSRNFDYSSYYAKSGADFSALYNKNANYGKDSIPYIINTAQELEDFLGTYLAHADDTNDFKNYARTIQNGFFDKHALMVLYVSAPTTPTEFELTSIFTVGHILAATLNYDIIAYDTQFDEKLIVAEVSKEEIKGCEVFQTLVTEINPNNIP